MAEQPIKKIGGYSYMVTLPVHWIRDNGFQEGDIVDVKVSKNYVIVEKVKKK
jgi:antitoxin component of MazEF toxin-antitoxin module